MSKRSYPVEEKLKILRACEEDKYSIYKIASIYKVNKSTIMEWKHKFDKDGIEGLKESTSWKVYSKELKLSAIRDYQSGEYSLREISRKYGLTDKSTLSNWIKKYNSHREVKDTSKERTGSMTKGRKTTWDERIQIVIDCLGNGKDYQKTAELHNVSYQQVYQWVKKYENGGDEALKDNRGRTKEEAELTPEEKTQIQIKKLERENERLRAENLFLKKLEEIERRRK